MLKSLTLWFLSWQSRRSRLSHSPHSPKLQLVHISKHMKTHRWFTRNRLVSHLRIASAVTLMSAAAAMAFVAVKPSGPLLLKSNNKNAINKFSQNRTALFRNKLAIPGPEREGGPTAAAEQDYVNRAGPAPYVPFELTRRAQRAWSNVRARPDEQGDDRVRPFTASGATFTVDAGRSDLSKQSGRINL